MAINLEDYADLVKSARSARPLGKWANLTSDLQEYFWLPRMRQRRNVETIGSHTFEWDLNLDTAGNAKHQSELTSDSTAQAPTMQTASVNLRHTQTSYTYTKGQMQTNGAGSLNRGDRIRLWNFIQKQRGDAWVDLADLIETTCWGSPTSSSDDTTPFGLLYGLTSKVTGDSLSTGSGEFGGAAPSGFTNVYNVNPSTYSRWKNWTHQYVNVTRDDLIYKMKLGAYKTKFKPPVKLPEINPMPDRAFYTNFSVSNELSNKLEDRNENLGTDLDVYGGRAHLKNAPIETVPQLDSDTANPVLQVDWNAVKIIVLNGFMFNETDPQINSTKHLVLEVYVDLTWAIALMDRRRFAYYALS